MKALALLIFLANLASAVPRAGVIRQKLAWDEGRPLGASDFPGWTMIGQDLIGAYEKHWLGRVNGGSDRWWFKLKSGLAGGLQHDDQSVFAMDRDGTIHSVDLQGGTENWQAKLGAFSVRPILITDQQVYVLTAAQKLFCLNKKTGETLWLYDAGFPDGLHLHGASAPVLANGVVVIGLANGDLQGIQDGKQVWQWQQAMNDFRFHDVVGEIAVRGGDILFTRFDGSFQKLTMNDGKVSQDWQKNLIGISASRAGVEKYYIGTSNGDLISFDRKNGQENWRISTGEAIAHLQVNEKFLFGIGGSGRVTAIDLVNGKELWHDSVGGNIVSEPWLDKEFLYVSTGSGNIYRYKI